MLPKRFVLPILLLAFAPCSQADVIAEAKKDLAKLSEIAAQMKTENDRTELVIELRKAGLTRAEAESTVIFGEKNNFSYEQIRKLGKDKAAQKMAQSVSQSHQDASWKYETVEDKMGGGKIKTASLYSQTEVNFKSPYEGAQRLELYLKQKHREQDVILHIPRGQFMCSEVQACNVSVRFDKDKVQKYRTVTSNDGSVNVLFIQNANQFISKLKESKAIAIESVFYQEGTRTFEFNTAGLKW